MNRLVSSCIIASMKTQVIHIESYDNLPSIQDKISNAEAFRLILVDNPSVDFILKKSSFVQLIRTCSSLGIQLGIVSKRYQVSALCDEYGVTVFEDLTSAQYKNWSENHVPKLDDKHNRKRVRLEKPADVIQKSENPIIRWVSFWFAIIAVIIILISVIPSATIVIDTPDIPDAVSFPIRLNANTTVVSITSGVPVISIERTDEIVLTESVSETSLMPVGFAKGEVIYTNLTNITGTIPAGTILSTLGDTPILFVTTNDTIIEGKKGFQAIGSAIAVEPGESGNVSAGDIQQIQAILPFQVQVSNPQNFTGGTSEDIKTPGVKDRNLVKAKALTALEERIISSISDDNAGEIVILPSTYQLVKVLSEEYYPSAGEPGNTITLHLKISAQVDGIRNNDLVLYFSDLAKLNLSNEITTRIDQESIRVDCTSDISSEDLHCNVTGERILSRKIDSGTIKRLVMGKIPSHAVTAIQAYFPDVSTVQIDTKPEGWFIIPLASFRINVEEK